MIYEPFTIQDEVRLKMKQEAEKSESWFLYAILGAFIGTFSCGRSPNNEPAFLKYGIFQAFFGSLAFFSILNFFPNFNKNRKIKKDLKNKIKKIEEVEILGKQRSFGTQQIYTLHLDAIESELRYIYVNETMYNKVSKGENVTLVLAPFTKFLFEIRAKNEIIVF
jgi:hypothetical protein